MIGIYKITSPTGRVYIGQSWHIEHRWKQYNRACLVRQPLIHKSIKKYGLINHKFEVVHFLPTDVNQIVLDDYEQLYMDLYKDAGVELLNIKGAGSRGKMNDDTKEKIRRKRIGSIASNETRIKMSKAGKGRKKSDDHRIKIGRSNKISQSIAGHQKGEKNMKAKLNEDIVKEIRLKHKPFKKKCNTILAKEYGVSVSTIERITSKSTWRHVA